MPELRLWPQGGLWRHGDFLRLWSAQTISQFGSQISGLALPLVAILLLDASAFEVAALGVVEFLPFIVFTLPAGAWVDRLRRRPILVISDWGRAAALATVPLAYVLDALTLTQLYAVGFVVGGFTVFFDVSYQSYLPSLVRREQLTDANGKLEVSRSAAQTAGPGVAGGLVSVLTAPYAILADSLSFVASALFVTWIKREEPLAADADAERNRLRTEIAEGLRFVIRHPIMRWNLVYVALANFFGNVIFSIYLVFVVRDLGLSPATIGLIGSLGSVGFLGGAIVAPRLASRFGIGCPRRRRGSERVVPTLDPAGKRRPRDSHARRVGTRLWLLRRRLQRHRYQSHAGHHTPSHAWPDERLSPVHRLGSDPARHVAGRGARLESRASRDPLDRCNRCIPRVHPTSGVANSGHQEDLGR